MKSKTFRLEETAIEQLKDIAEAKNMTQSDAIRFAIQEGHDAIQAQDTGNTEKSDDGTDWKALYFTEKQRNDSISEKLMQLSDKVADSLRAEKVGQVLDKAPKALESTERKAKKPWWKFWA